MKQYKCLMPLEIRSSSGLSKNPEYVIRGYGAVPNSPEIYRYIKDKKSGIVTKSFKSLFTDNAIASMNRQAKSKKIFVDAEHKTGVGINVKSYLDNLDIPKEDKEKILQQIELTDLPIAKVKEVNIDSSGKLIFDIRLNPNYREINPKYFDAVWNSLQEGFIDGLSTTFVPTKVIQQDGFDMIDDVDLYGIEFTGGASSPDTQIFEVSMRAAQEFSNELEARKMNEELERKTREIQERENAVKAKEEEIRKSEEAKKQEILRAEQEEFKKMKDELKAELETVKKARESGGSRQLVSPENQGQNQNEALESIKLQNEVHELMEKNLRTRKNPSGNLSFGQVLAMDYESIDGKRTFAQARHAQLEPIARSNLGTGADIAITRPKRVL